MVIDPSKKKKREIQLRIRNSINLLYNSNWSLEPHRRGYIELDSEEEAMMKKNKNF